MKWSRSVMSDSLWPHGLWPTRLLHSWDFPGKHTGVGCHFLLQGIFLTWESNPGLWVSLWMVLFTAVYLCKIFTWEAGKSYLLRPKRLEETHFCFSEMLELIIEHFFSSTFKTYTCCEGEAGPTGQGSSFQSCANAKISVGFLCPGASSSPSLSL